MRFYFDHNATTPVDPRVREAMARALEEDWGNPSSIHRDGQRARVALEEARRKVGAYLGAGPKEIVFTSGGTEADNLAVLGAVRADGRPRKHVITAAVEHPAVLEAARRLESEGVAVTYLQPSREGVIDVAAVKRMIRPETVLVSVMHANNETGAVQPLAEVGRVCREAGVLLHSDGVQFRRPVKVSELGVDLYSISGHKLNAPKGVGALYVRAGVEIEPLLVGGRQERGRRAGTENPALAVALAEACSLERPELSKLRDRLERGILERVPDVKVNSGGVERTPNTSNLMFEGIGAEALLIALDLRGFAVSTGSACSSGSVEPSHVLLAMGLAPEEARASVRFSLGAGNDEAQVDALIGAVEEAVAQLRRLSPVYAS